MFLSNGVVGKFVLGFVTLSVYVGMHGSDHLVHACKLLYEKIEEGNYLYECQ